MISKYFVFAAVVGVLLAGCSGNPGPSASSIAPQSEPTSTALTPAPEPGAGQAADIDLDSEAIREIVFASFLAFEERGMTEIAVSQGDEFALLFDPDIEDYQAVLLDKSTGLAELIYETDYFTIFVLYLMAEGPSGDFTQESPSLFLAQDPDYGNIRFFVQDGLIRSAEAEDQSWQATFEYSVDPGLREVLLTERQKLLDSFEE